MQQQDGDVTDQVARDILQVLATDPGTELSPAEVARRVNGGEGLPLAAIQQALNALRTGGLIDRRKDYARAGRSRWIRVYSITAAGRESAGS